MKKGAGQDGCVQRIEVFVKMEKKVRESGRGGGGQEVGGQGGCVERIDVFVKMQK